MDEMPQPVGGWWADTGVSGTLPPKSRAGQPAIFCKASPPACFGQVEPATMRSQLAVLFDGTLSAALK
jgi:hypothetical protein